MKVPVSSKFIRYNLVTNVLARWCCSGCGVGVDVVSLVFGLLFAGVVTSMVSGVELWIWFRVFVTIDGDRNERCVASWVCVLGTICVSGIVVMTDCAFFCNGDVLRLFSLVGVVF